VTAPSQLLAKIGADLQKLDIPPPQILIEAIAVELTDTTDRDIGFIIGNQDRSSFSSIDTPGGLITYNSIGRMSRNFEANLKALELTGKARVRARPQMAVLNGRTANIFIGAQRFILTQFISGGLLQTRIQPVDVGVKLQITPLTGGNNEITTRVTPEVSNITELDLQTGLPVLSSRRADTTVRVKDGETIVIGGLTLNQEQTADRKIPVLGNLPLIGRLFRGKKQNVVRTELVVFVTPHILSRSPLGTNTSTVPTDTAGTVSGSTPNGNGTPIAPAAPDR
jgi:type II secretory pathway component GspD/PulD (secretin)